MRRLNHQNCLRSSLTLTTLASILLLSVPSMAANKKAIATPTPTLTPAPLSLSDVQSPSTSDQPCPSKEMTISYNGSQTSKLSSLGSGIRRKKIAFIDINIYCAQYWADTSAADPKVKFKAISLKLMRDLASSKIEGAFNEALVHNGVNVDSKPIAEIKALFQKVPELKKYNVISIVGASNETESAILLKLPDGSQKAVTGDKDLADQFFSIWLGKPVDSDMEKLKSNLLQ